MNRGESKQFHVNFYPGNTTDDRNVTYMMTDDSVGTITPDGLFTATGRGRTILAVRCGRFVDTVDIYSRVPLTGIETSEESCKFSRGETDAFLFTPVPEDTTDELQISYISENTNVVKVDENGTVTAVGGGTADVVLTVNGFEKRRTYAVVVPITGVGISNTHIRLYEGDHSALSAAVQPKGTTDPDKSIVWTSDDPAIVTVNANGGLAALSLGTTVIRATHGRFQAACVVDVCVRPDPNVVADNIINFGKQFLGTPYVYGGNSLTGGIDCSSFTRQCFASQGIGLPMYSYTQVNAGTPVSTDPSAWRKGDLLFYSPHGGVSHVAIYIGNGQILHSAESQGGVCITPYNYFGMGPSHVRRYF